MFNPARSNDNLPNQRKHAQDLLSHGTQLPVEQSDNNSWQTVHCPGTMPVDQVLGDTPHAQANAMDSLSTHPDTSIHPDNNTSTIDMASSEQTSQREAELLNLVRDLNECNDVLLAKVSQLEESLERSQTALQAEIDRSGPAVGDREIVQLVSELEQSSQALQQHQQQTETLQTDLAKYRERATHLETEHAILLQQHAAQSQELLQANTNCRDLRARLQRQQRYTLQFKAALEKCLSMSTELSHGAAAGADVLDIAMPKADEIRPWESTLGNGRLDPQLESMIRGLRGQSDLSPALPLEAEAEDQLWHDLARVMEPGAMSPESDERRAMPLEEAVVNSENMSSPFTEPSSPSIEPSPQKEPSASVEPSPFMEPSPWGDMPIQNSNEQDESAKADGDSKPIPQLSPQAAEILARVQASQVISGADTYLPAMSGQGSPSPLVNPLKPQKRIGSLAAIDLPNFPRLKKQTPEAKA